ncbi:hypothetical protein VPH35_007183 [Triticum aestivum]
MAAAAGSSSSRQGRRCPSPPCACGSPAIPTPTSAPSVVDGRSTGRGSRRCSVGVTIAEPSTSCCACAQGSG